MNSANLTRAEAARRADLVSVASYQVTLDLTTGDTTFASRTEVAFSTDPAVGSQTWIDLIAPTLHRVTLNGRPVDIAGYDGNRIELTDLEPDNLLVVEADCAYMNTGEGLHRFVDPVDDEVYLYSQFETADARRMYACFEQPDLKATFQLTVTAPRHWKVVSNAPTPVPTPVAEDCARWEFAPTPRISTYITALVAGPYHQVDDEYVGANGTYPLGIFCRRSLAEHLDADEILTVTKQGFAFFEETFQTPYPFGKYDQLFVPEFNAGAMENAACVTFLEDYVFRSRVTYSAYEQRANTILHEMAHMWFGDLVTMKWWDDLWLNESFAEWASHFASVAATRYTDAWTSFAVLRKAWAYRQDQLPSTHPIAADMVDLDAVRVNFDGITYAKGASALKQLVAWVGEEEFIAGLRAYFAEFAWGNTELRDLLGHLETASGRDLSGWTRQWLQTAGVNLLRPEIEVTDDVVTSFAIRQEPPSMPPGLEPVLRDHRLGVGLYHDQQGQLVRERSVEVDVTGELTPVPELVGSRRPELVLLNDGDLTFAKIRLDDHSVQTAVSGIGRIDDSLARTLIWGAAWDMTRDAEMTCGAYIDLVCAGIVVEPDVSVVQTTLRQAKAAIDQYAAPEHRERYATTLATCLWEAATASDPGSDHQLAFVRAFSALAAGDDELDRLAALLSGDLVLHGLSVDTDLRWTLLQSLAAAGRADDAAIEAEAAADATATGKRQRALALAARPTPAAKEAAWAAIIEDGSTANAIIEATMGGFAQPGQEELLTPYRDRYFAALDDLWATRTPEMAQSITMLLYPFLLIDDTTIAAADAYLAGDSISPSARRLVSEGRDAMLRAQRARALDAS
ncbi:MAG: aminopeptidase N [Candidatus Nanopelagicales bacterium]